MAVLSAIGDTAAVLQKTVADATTGQPGTMVASAANGFGQIKFQPSGHGCQELPYSFHPMFSTSSPKTRVLWTAHGSNVAFSDEVGHFNFCTMINANTGACSGQEGAPGDQEPAVGDDFGCFSAANSLLYPATGCVALTTQGSTGPRTSRTGPTGTRPIRRRSCSAAR